MFYETPIKTRPNSTLAPGGRPRTGRDRSELFSGLTADEISAVLASATFRKFAAKRTIIRSGEPAQHLFLLDAGAVDAYRVAENGQEILLRRLSPGEAFGLGTLLPRPTAYVATMETLSECEFYVWEHRWVRQFSGTHPQLADNALRIALEYIRLYSERHLACISSGAEHRVAGTLTRLGNRIGHRNSNGLEVQITNRHLASLADVGSFTVSRLLKKLERKGALVKGRGKVLIRRPERLVE